MSKGLDLVGVTPDGTYVEIVVGTIPGSWVANFILNSNRGPSSHTRCSKPSSAPRTNIAA